VGGATGPVVSSPEAAVVRPVAVARCDLDVGVLQGAFPLPGPYPFGHEGVAEVVEVGAAVTSVAAGDLVVVPFGRAHARPAIPQVFELVVRGFDPSLVTSQVVAWNDAVDALVDPPLKLVVSRP